MSRKDIIKEKKIILGVLRELFLVPTVITSKIENRKIHLTLQDLLENSRRNLDEIKKIRFEISETGINLPKGGLLSIELESKRFKAVAEVIVVNCSEQFIETTVPERLLIVNARRSNRRPSNFIKGLAVPVILETNGVLNEGVFFPEDISTDGFGGKLSAPSDFPINIESCLVGRISAKHASLPVRAKIVRASILERVGSNENIYSVGLHQMTITPTEGPPTEERRKTIRVAGQQELKLVSLLKSNTIEIRVTDASVSGFAAQIKDMTADWSFSVGAPFNISGTSILLELISFADQILRFQIAYSNEADRLFWFKTFSQYLHPTASINIQDAAEIYQMFCDAGALSAEFLKTHSPYSTELMEQFETIDNNHFWIHRWVSRSSSKETLGYISAIKMGDNCWLLGDIAGSQAGGEKLPPDFISKFFTSFSELSLASQPCPRHLIIWVDGHNYWAPFEIYTQGKGRSYIFESALHAYTRLVSLKSAKRAGSIPLSEIAPSNHSMIGRLRAQLIEQGLFGLASAFDLDLDRFGSPQLSDAFRSHDMPYVRHYYYGESEGFSFIAILSKFPLGLSINRVPESAWVFPLTGAKLSTNNWQIIVNSIHVRALELGIKLPSIRRFISQKNHTEKLLPSEHVLLNTTLAHPLVWDYFKDVI